MRQTFHCHLARGRIVYLVHALDLGESDVIAILEAVACFVKSRDKPFAALRAFASNSLCGAR
jgi:hypothetical protein